MSFRFLVMAIFIVVQKLNYCGICCQSCKPNLGNSSTINEAFEKAKKVADKINKSNGENKVFAIPKEDGKAGIIYTDNAKILENLDKNQGGMIAKNNAIIEKFKKERQNTIGVSKPELVVAPKSTNQPLVQQLINNIGAQNPTNQPLVPQLINNVVAQDPTKPILVGLNNIGATCFMNSTLQCLSQTKQLTDYFLNEDKANDIINNNIALENRSALQLSPLYKQLIQQLWNQSNHGNTFSPDSFIGRIRAMFSVFKNKNEAGDAKDVIINILEQLHKELRKPIQFPNNNTTNNNINEPLNQYDRGNAFGYFFNEFKNECSIISDVFFGISETTNECLNCKKIYNDKGLNNPICYNYQIFNCLIFPLEEVKNMKNNTYAQYNNNMQMNLNNRVNLYECFFYNQKTELFTGQNQNYCNICKQLYDSMYTSRIFSSPNVLVIILNRGKGNIFDVKLDFTETIDISQFVLQRDKPQIIYNLYGVITHIGQSGPSAHFVASCKSQIDNKWYRFNDAMINPITNIQKEVIDFGTPYVLFYKKQE